MREKLSEGFCTRVEQAGYYADGGGLYLNVKPDGRKYWCFRWRDRHARYTTPKSTGVGKLREKGLGRYGRYDVSLTEARELAGSCRRMLRQGKDPIEQARQMSRDGTAKNTPSPTFGECITRYVNAHQSSWRNEKQAQQWSSMLNRHAAPLLTLPVAVINADHVLECLEPIWGIKTETATRVRQRIESVLDWAARCHYRSAENPARWRGHLDRVLPQPSRLKKPKSRAALHYQKLNPFMAALRNVDSLAARALELQILTATRPGDVVAAQWSEFGLKGAVWNIPASRFKANLEHTVPLSPPALRLLKNLQRTADYVFPGRSGSSGITTAAGMKLLKTLQPGITQQGFRITFREWAVNQSGYPAEVIAHALGPQSKDTAAAAYLRSDLIAQRARLMSDWAMFCDTSVREAMHSS
jgi:integrase